MQRFVRSLLVSTTVIAVPVVGATVAVATPAGPETHTVRADNIDTVGGVCGSAADALGVIDPAFARKC
ncbi:hypothetical protein [Embleya sp. NBC_00896]|uniref:hypothetical protein n=1 Tax=Embleya sp. NBC_00896 TaxID=2975961 RepID=UPI003865B828|nr:hypothetical protein OG928_22155 [Embleya sp. NBC_00896]